MTDTKGSTSSKRGCYIAIVFALVVGIVIGAFVGARFRPNHITFRVADSNKVYLVANKGDIIDWKTENLTLTSINFISPSPCFTVPGSLRCVFTPTTADADVVYVYGCNTFGRNSICVDPGMANGSTTGGPQPGKIKRFLNWLNNLFTYFATLFAGSEFERPFTLEPTSAVTTGGQEAPSAAAIPSQLANNVPSTSKPYLACDQNNATLYDLMSMDTVDHNTVSGTVGKTLEWDAAVKYSFTLSAGICGSSPVTITNDPTIQGGTKSCTIAQGAATQPNVTITTGCSGSNTIQMNLNIP